ncbi:GNAT family N-acetyltransferase [Ornithinibacillus hominis]|nr:GNAT family N-acetyltransferase [Ornithinibacillus hominis]
MNKTEENIMVKTAFIEQEDVEKVARFIAELNRLESSHIGFCGKDSIEIAEYMKEEIPYPKSFVAAQYEGDLLGVVGIDPDFDSGVGEVWGPFVIEEQKGIVDQMWVKLLENKLAGINTFLLFPNKENKLVHEFAIRNGFSKGSEQAILIFDRNDVHRLQDSNLMELTAEYHDEMVALHDQLFPGTYYSGQQIIDRLDERNKVFILVEDEELCGYVYVEAEPEFSDGSIEFVGVHQSKRSKGIGSQLIAGSLKWLFTFETIPSIRLTVSAENKTAVNLYQKAGFRLQHSLNTFKKDRK